MLVMLGMHMFRLVAEGDMVLLGCASGMLRLHMWGRCHAILGEWIGGFA